LWRLEALIGTGVTLLAAVAAAVVIVVTDATPTLLVLPVVGWAVIFVVSVIVFPRLAYARFRFGIDDEEIDIQRGRVWIERVLVPMARVQHVDTERGPLQRRLGLASVVVHTAAGGFEIPALDLERAVELRTRIAVLARVSDEL
jgi:membrane protein YdbS with pleckstrin-like domain